jgi:hypothetical protein
MLNKNENDKKYYITFWNIIKSFNQNEKKFNNDIINFIEG